ncbi:MAG: holo-ACP synthase [Actinomycetes bacterium]
MAVRVNGAGVVGLGTDLVEIGRFRAVLDRRPRIADRVFEARERAALAGRRDPVPGLAARFAAKEAVMKALGVGLGAFALAQVEVERGADGAPTLRLHGRAAALAADRGVREWRLSLSHSDTTAMAVALALG